MRERNYSKLCWIAAFIVFAAVSCWATSESLHMLLATWPKIICWVVAIGFFLIASLGSKMIADSFNKNIYLEKRGLRLIGGIVIVLVFWLVCSMPTNTHTFFYRTVINDKVTNDIATTQNYLAQIENNTKNEEQAERKVTELRNNIDIELGELEAEIMNDVNPGDGPRSKEIRRRIANTLGVAQIDALSYRGTSKQERVKLCDEYRKKIYALTQVKEDNIRAHILSPSEANIREVHRIYTNLSLLKDYITDKTIDLNNADDVAGAGGVCDQVNEGYNAIKNNQDFVNFASEADKENYTADNPVTKVKRLISVFDVWEDYLHGDYAGHGFLFWIIISILVDLAAFIFFTVAFRATSDV